MHNEKYGNRDIYCSSVKNLSMVNIKNMQNEWLDLFVVVMERGFTVKKNVLNSLSYFITRYKKLKTYRRFIYGIVEMINKEINLSLQEPTCKI